MKSLFEQMGGTYTKVGDYYLPNLIPVEKEIKIGIWGQRHARYLKEHHKVVYYELLTSGRLNEYLADLNEQAEDMFFRMVKELAEKEGITETLKVENQMLWVQRMNVIRQGYGDARVGIAITDPLNITAQGLETIQRNNSDKIVLRRLDEILEKYEVDTLVVGMPYNLRGEKTVRAEKTEQFIHKLKCKYNKMKIETIDERLTTVAAHKTMNFLEVNKNKKRDIVDTISAVYILETYINKKN